MRIGILDDEVLVAEWLEDIISSMEHSCQVFHSGRRLVNALHRDTFDLLLLDWNVPDLSGLAILQWMRDQLDWSPPVMFLTGRSADEDIVAGLRMGADDFVTKPVQSPVLLARVEAVLRRAYGGRRNYGLETYGSYVFDIDRESISLNGEPLTVTPKEFMLALMLFRNGHRSLSRDYILEAVWGHRPGLPTRTLDAHISKIRSKLSLRAENGFRLLPIYAFGYRLEAA